MSSTDAKEVEQSDITLDSVIDGKTERGIPIVKYVDDIGEFSNQFTPPASAELLIGAYTDLFSKFKALEARMTQKCECTLNTVNDVCARALWPQERAPAAQQCSTAVLTNSMLPTLSTAANFKEKIPEIEESLALVKKLKSKQDEQEALVTRYSLADAVFGKAEIDTASGLVGLWLGANVMLEYTYDDAIELLSSKEVIAKREFEEVSSLVVAVAGSCLCLEPNQTVVVRR